MIRKEAITFLAKMIGNQPIISANGFISRDLFESYEKETNFYMIGSMGLASSIGLGIAIKNPKKRIYVFDGDGNILMNLGSLVTIGAKMPKNLVHIVFDNSSHESTGGQPTNSFLIKIEKIAKSTNYLVYVASTTNHLKQIFQKIKSQKGPIMIVVKIKKSKIKSTRVMIAPHKIKDRFMKSIKM